MAEPRFDGLRFSEAAEFFRSKVRLPTQRWTDLREGMHARAFVVAGAMKDELLADMQAAVQKALDRGGTIESFRADFDRIVEKHGWKHRGGRNWRSRVIFETNLRTAHMAGRWEQLQRTKKRRPYLRYVAVLDTRTRPDHRLWHGTVLPIDHDWWRTHYPPNGWNCRCTVQSLSAANLEEFGYALSKAPPKEPLVFKPDPFAGARTMQPRGIDAGWAYNVGEAHVGRRVSEAAFEEARTKGAKVWEPLEGAAYRARTWADYDRPRTLPPRPAPAQLRRVKDKAEAAAALRSMFGGESAVYRADDGAAVELYADLLAEHLPLDRFGFLSALPEVLERPDEVWLSFERHAVTGRVALRKRFLAAFEGDRQHAVLLVAEAMRGAFVGWTVVPTTAVRSVQAWRRGFLWLARDG